MRTAVSGDELCTSLADIFRAFLRVALCRVGVAEFGRRYWLQFGATAVLLLLLLSSHY